MCSPVATKVSKIRVDGKTPHVEWRSGYGLVPKNLDNWNAQLTRHDAFDAYGNVTQTREGSTNTQFSWLNYSYIATSYATHSNRWMYLPRERILRMKHSDGQWQITKHDQYYYDNLNIGQIGQGLLTKHASLNDYGNLVNVQHTHDSFGNTRSTTDPLGNQSLNVYDGVLGRYLVRSESPAVNGIKVTKVNTYDGKWNLDTVTDGSKVMQYEHDAFGRVTSKTGDVTPVYFQYSAFDNSTSSDNTPFSWVKVTKRDSSPDKWHVTYRYNNGFGKPIQIKSENVNGNEEKVWKTNNIANYVMGNQSIHKKFMPYNSTSSAFEHFSGNSNNNVVTTKQYLMPGSGTITEKHMPNGAVIKQIANAQEVVSIDARGHVSKLLKQPELNRVITKQFTGTYPNHVFEADVIKETFPDRVRYFNADGHLVRTDHVSYKGNILQQIDVDRGNHHFAYNDKGFVTEKTDAKGQTTYFHYDAIGRKSLIDYPNQADTEFYYDGDMDGDGSIDLPNAIGQLSYVVDNSGWNKMYFDRLGRMTRETKHIHGLGSNDTLFRYGIDNTLSQYRLPGERSQGSGWNTVSYNDAGAVEAITDVYGTELVSDIDSDVFGRLTWVHFADDVSAEYRYYGSGRNYRMARFISRKGSQPYTNMYYDYDISGNLTSLYDARDTQRHNMLFTYDHLNRLATREDPWFLQGRKEYQYSPAGNLLHKEGQNFTYQQGTHRISYDGQYQYSYDENGSVSQMEEFSFASKFGAPNALGFSFSYNDEGKLAQLVQPGTNGGQVNYTYDYRGKLVKAESADETTFYVNGYYEVRNGEAIRYHYVSDKRAVKVTDSGTQYLLNDYLGSASVMFDSNGTWRKQIYDPFGQFLDMKGSLNEMPDYGFVGRESFLGGMMHMGARFYNPNTGRFLSADSIYDPMHPTQGMNRYSYVSNNPLRFNDPTGHNGNEPTTVEELVADGFVAWAGIFERWKPGSNERLLTFAQNTNDTIAAADEWNFQQTIYGEVSINVDAKGAPLSGSVVTGLESKIGKSAWSTQTNFTFYNASEIPGITMTGADFVKSTSVMYDYNGSQSGDSMGRVYSIDFGTSTATALTPGWGGGIVLSLTFEQDIDNMMHEQLWNAISGLPPGAPVEDYFTAISRIALDGVKFKVAIYGDYGAGNGGAVEGGLGLEYSVEANGNQLVDALFELYEHVNEQDPAGNNAKFPTQPAPATPFTPNNTGGGNDGVNNML